VASNLEEKYREIEKHNDILRNHLDKQEKEKKELLNKYTALKKEYLKLWNEVW